MNDVKDTIFHKHIGEQEGGGDPIPGISGLLTDVEPRTLDLVWCQVGTTQH